MYLELKDYKLRFIKNVDTSLKKGINVGLYNLMPINQAGFGFIEEVRVDLLGFDYGVREFFTNELVWHHPTTIQSILPVLVSDEEINKGDKIYLDSGEIRECQHIHEDDNYHHSIIFDEKGKWHFRGWVQKIIATPSMFGLSINFGPPHDRNYDWKYDKENKRYVYLEAYLPSQIHYTIKHRDFNMRIVVNEICPNYGGSHIGKDCSCKSGFIVVPKSHNGQIIMDAYGLLGKKDGYYFHK